MANSLKEGNPAGNNDIPLTSRGVGQHNVERSHSAPELKPNFDEWNPAKVLFLYMQLRAHEMIPETKKLLELLRDNPLSALSKGIREGHEGRVNFLKRCWEEGSAVGYEAGAMIKERLDQGWVMLDNEAVDGEAWEELGNRVKEA
ncbi:MAG: hypothetical protein Q9181_001051 [Wetmoreana brouardii]